MATLQRIRNHSVALLVIVGLAMLAFIIGDLLTSSSSIMQSQRDKVVVINGKKVTYEEFETERQRKTEFLKSMMGQDLDNNASQQLTQQVYQEFVTKTLLDEQCNKLGLAVTKDEINELVQGNNLSPVLTQMFGQQAPQMAAFFVNLISNDGFEEASKQYPFATLNNWMEIENQIVLNRKAEKYNALIAAAVKPNKLEAKDNFEGDNTECSFAYVKQNAISVADSLVTVSENDVKAYYESTRRNYKLTAARRAASYIAVALNPSQADFAEALEEMNSVRDEFATTSDMADLTAAGSTVPYIDAFVNVNNLDGEIRTFVEGGNVGDVLEPNLQQGNIYMMARIMDKKNAADSVEISMVVVPTKEEADSIQQVLDKAAHAVEAIASYSDQQKYNGWANDAFLFQNFGNEVRNLITETANGKCFNHEMKVGTNSAFYVGKVTKRTAATQLAKVAVYAVEVIPSSTTRRDEFGRLNQFLTEHKSVKEMQDSAMAAGFMMMPTTVYSTNYNIGSVQDARQAVRFIFNGKKGDISEIFEAGDNLLVVTVNGDVEDGYLSLSDKEFYNQISQFYVTPRKKVDYLAEKFNAISGDLNAYAQAFETSVDTAQFVNFNIASISGLGIEPAIVGAAVKAAEGQIINVPGMSNVVALQVLSKNDKGLEYNEAERLANVVRSREYVNAQNGAFNILQNEAEIEDNRISFY